MQWRKTMRGGGQMSKGIFLEEIRNLQKGDWIELADEDEDGTVKAHVTDVKYDGRGRPYIKAETKKAIFTIYAEWYVPGIRRVGR